MQYLTYTPYTFAGHMRNRRLESLLIIFLLFIAGAQAFGEVSHQYASGFFNTPSAASVSRYQCSAEAAFADADSFERAQHLPINLWFETECEEEVEEDEAKEKKHTLKRAHSKFSFLFTSAKCISDCCSMLQSVEYSRLSGLCHQQSKDFLSLFSVLII